jgi:hypothetical protein
MSKEIRQSKLVIESKTILEDDGNPVSTFEVSYNSRTDHKEMRKLATEEVNDLMALIGGIVQNGCSIFEGVMKSMAAAEKAANDNHSHCNQPGHSHSATTEDATSPTKASGTESPIADDGGYVPPTTADAACAEGDNEEEDDIVFLNETESRMG